MKKEEKHPIIENKKHKGRIYSIKEGIFASAQGALGGQYISPFAIAINASNSLVALFASISGLLGPLSQLITPKLLKNSTRKKVVTKAVLTEALMWLPLIAIAFLFYYGFIKEVLPLVLLIFFSISIVAFNIGQPAWFSWVGDIVDEKYRGRWFAKRNLITGFVLAFLSIISAFVLDFFHKKGFLMFGFILLFFFAFLSRMSSYVYLKKQYEPELKRKKSKEFSFFSFIKELSKNNFGKFSLFRTFLSFAASISSPLIAVYLLRTLNFTYINYVIVTMAGTIFSLFVLELWGKFSDKYGDYRTMLISSIFIPAIPVLWILSPSKIYMILVPAFIGGVAWAGFNLSSTNFIYDNVSSEKRSTKVAYFNLLNGIGIFFGAGLGAYLIKVLHTTSLKPIIWIFILGSILRAIVILIGITKIKEIRKTKKFDSKEALKRMLLKEAKPTLSEEAHAIISIPKYLKVS